MTGDYILSKDEIVNLNFVSGYVQGTSARDGEEELMEPIKRFVKLVFDITQKSGLK
jgi:hypothetical protein